MARLGAVACGILIFIAAGCVKGEGTAPAPSPATAEKTDSTGGLQGNILTDEVQPIQNAQVALHGTNQTTTSGVDGGFAFSNLDPGEYTVLVGALGYFSNQKKATVKAGEVTEVDLVLDRIPIAAPSFDEVFKWEDTLIVSDACPNAPEMTPGMQGVTWQDYPLTINDSKPDGTALAASRTFIELKSQPDAATVDIDLYFLDSEGAMISDSTSAGPNENITIKKVLPAGDYIVRSCLWTGANSHYALTVTVTYEQGEAAQYARDKGSK